jgi:hypothetical protein
MSSIIKNFNSFRSVNEDESFISRAFSALGDSAKDALKGKVVSSIMARMGVPKGPQGQPTVGETIITKLVEQIGISEYPKFIAGDVQVRDLAPRLAKATVETLTKLGVDGMATRILKIDPSSTNTFLYRTLENLIENASARKDFQQQIENMWYLILGASPDKSGIEVITGQMRDKSRGSESSSQSSSNPEDWSMENIIKAMSASSEGGQDMMSQGRGTTY